MWTWLRAWLERFLCPECHRLVRCECGWVAAGVIVAAIGVAVAVGGAAQSAHQQQQAAKFNKRVAQNSALAARQAAEANADQRKEHLRRVLAQQRANIGGSGVSDTSGSPLLVQIDSARQAELDALRIAHGGEQQALGFEAQGAYARYAGRQAAQASYTQAGGSLLQGVGQGITTYQRYRAQQPSGDGV